MKLSEHSKKRMRQRTKLNHKERRLLFRRALDNGESPDKIKDEKIKAYLFSKCNYKSKVKLYKNFVFIYSKHSKLLYTMYKLPKKFLDKKED